MKSPTHWHHTYMYASPLFVYFSHTEKAGYVDTSTSKNFHELHPSHILMNKQQESYLPSITMIKRKNIDMSGKPVAIA